MLRSWGTTGLDLFAKKLQNTYAHRRNVIVDAANEFVGASNLDEAAPAEWVIPQAGMFIWFKLSLAFILLIMLI
jgi:DNA-binding transcriptional MocR family regulator